MVTTTQQGFQRSLRKAEKALCQTDDVLKAHIGEIGKCGLSPMWERSPYESLVRAVAHQQLHGKAAEAILARLIDSIGKGEFPEAGKLAKAKEEKIRSLGFSAAKTSTILGVAKASVDGTLPTRAVAESMSNDELIERITPLRGIGSWTVEMMLIFTLGRLDVMPVDDFGVKKGLQIAFDLKELPKRKEFLPYSAAWAPYRSVAAWYLWRIADKAKVNGSR